MRKIILAINLVAMSASSFATERFNAVSTDKAECISDQRSNLIWMKAPLAKKYTWAGANSYVKALTLCDYTDWRLATKEEQIFLQSNAGDYAPFAWFNTHGFTGIQTDFYWSSETYAEDRNTAWGVFMYSGKVYNEVKSGQNFVWPVRDNKILKPKF